MQSCQMKGEERADADTKQISERMQVFYYAHMPATSGAFKGVGTL